MRTYPTKNYVTLRDVTRNCCATFLFIFCCKFAFSQTNYLKLPAGSPRVITGQSNLIIENLSFTNLTGNIIQIYSSSNIIIRNCYFGVSSGEAINIQKSSNITVENCLFANNKAGVYAAFSSTIKVLNNQFVNAQGPMPRGQFVQYNSVTGAGNAVIGNRGESFRGESYPEDLISMFKTNGTPESPVIIKDNLFRGGGPSPAGGGIAIGDYDGSNIVVENNTVVSPGSYGIAAAGGTNITMKNNTVYSEIKPWSNCGLFAWGQQGVPCSNIIITGNKSNWTHKNGYKNSYWDGKNCGIIDWSTNTRDQSLASMNFPDQLITCVTEDELWQVRDQSREFVINYYQVDINRPPWLPRPTANAGSDKTVNTTGTTLSGSGGNSYRWVQVEGPNNAILSNANSNNVNLSGLVNGIYIFRLEASDTEGAADADWVAITVSQPEPNQLPSADAGNNIVLTLPANTTTLTGSGTDADGTIASYAWSQISGPATFTVNNANADITAINDLVLGTYVFRLTVTDNSGAIDTDEITVTVNAAPVINEPPVADAGNNIVLTLPANTTALTGSGTDADGTIASYVWSQVSGPSTFTLGSGNTTTATLSNFVQGTYVFRLTVTDNSGAIDTDDMTVTVNAAPVINQPPVANAGNNILLTLPATTTILTGRGTDADGTIASYAWSQVSGPSTFTLGTGNTTTATLSNLVLGTYVFRLTVTDNSGATDTDNMTVIVNAAPVINQPPVANAGNNIVLTLPANTTTLTGSGIDADGTIASYAWSYVSGPSTFTLGSGNTTTATLSNFVQGTYVFRLTVTDNSGATDTDNMTVTVNAAPLINQPPVAKVGNNIVLTLPANTTTLTGNGTDADGTIASYVWSKVSGPATFTLGSANAAISTVSNLVQGTYVFRLKVTDNSGAIDTDDITVTVNAAPVINQSPVANAGNNIVLTLPANTTILTGRGTDADGTIASYAWSYVSGPSTFTLGTGNTTTATLSNLVQGTYVFRLTVTDNSGATDTNEMTVTVNAAPVTNQPPVANAGVSQITTLSSNEIILSGTLSRDPDGVIKSYKWEQISGTGSAIIVSATSVSTKVSGFMEGDYVFQLTVTDNLNAISKDTITVAVVNNFRSYPGGLMLYPNPATDKIAFSLYNEKYKTAQINIYDITGRKVLPVIGLINSQNRFSKTIDISQFKKGIYLIEIIMDKREKATVKFVKQ